MIALVEPCEKYLRSYMEACDDDNCGSAKVMENNGFALQDKVPNVVNGKAITTRRYTKEV